jgi:hypothetical protein
MLIEEEILGGRSLRVIVVFVSNVSPGDREQLYHAFVWKLAMLGFELEKSSQSAGG